MMRPISLAPPNHVCMWRLFQTVNTLGVAFNAMSMPLTGSRSKRQAAMVGMRQFSSGPKASQYVYVVTHGRKPGVYETWAECAEQVNGYKSAVYQKVKRTQLTHFQEGCVETNKAVGGMREHGLLEVTGSDERLGVMSDESESRVEEDVKKPSKTRKKMESETEEEPTSLTGAKEYRVLTVYVDGAARGNPGAASYGILIRNDAGKNVMKIAKRLGSQTNNVAEWEGALAGLQSALELGAEEVHLMSDSNLVVNQISGLWKINDPTLRKLHSEAIKVVKRFSHFDATWIPRAKNQVADGLANSALDYGDSVWQSKDNSDS
uniref:RNase H type-1 domain-containing protein n=1 Tax=Guillardia theta TaxID=55529 RepID=A0A7S4JGQ3_GUITH|mmetsp:Transcript_16294/g.54581  ORF Transcript_16294/g.54581 Transcript_16294/m.54581 type:complete len:320 (+) Transcript_16294:193-1152(+)